MTQRALAAFCAALAAALAAPGLPAPALASHAPAPAPAPANHTYGRCELARELVGRLRVPKEEVATWVCIAFHESRFDTSAVGRLSGQSLDHGLFQISDLYWCGVRGPGGGCGVACEALRDSDIADDVQCARLIRSEHTRYTGDGFDAWAVYTRGDCTPAKRAVFVEGCFPDDAPPGPVPSTYPAPAPAPAPYPAPTPAPAPYPTPAPAPYSTPAPAPYSTRAPAPYPAPAPAPSHAPAPAPYPAPTPAPAPYSNPVPAPAPARAPTTREPHARAPHESMSRPLPAPGLPRAPVAAPAAGRTPPAALAPHATPRRLA